jgi:hypothetical protein
MTSREHKVSWYRQIDICHVLEFTAILFFLLTSGLVVYGLFFVEDDECETKPSEVMSETQPSEPMVYLKVVEVPASAPSDPVLSLTEEPRVFFGRPITPLAEQLSARITIPLERLEVYMKAIAKVEKSNTVGAAGELGRWQFTRKNWIDSWEFWIKNGLVKTMPEFKWINCDDPTYAACAISGYAMRYEPEAWIMFSMNDHPGSTYTLAILHNLGWDWRNKPEKIFERGSKYADRVVNIILLGKEVK